MAEEALVWDCQSSLVLSNVERGLVEGVREEARDSRDWRGFLRKGGFGFGLSVRAGAGVDADAGAGADAGVAIGCGRVSESVVIGVGTGNCDGEAGSSLVVETGIDRLFSVDDGICDVADFPYLIASG